MFHKGDDLTVSRRRFISTDISSDKTLNALAKESDFAALLFSWIIPHTEDDGSITADPEQLKWRVMPGREDKSLDDFRTAIEAIKRHVNAHGQHLMIEHEGRLYYPPETFYKYQSYINLDKRLKSLPSRNSSGKQPAATGSKDQQGTASSLLFSSLPSLSSKKKIVRDPQVKEFIDWFFQAYQSAVGEKYHVNGGKDGAVVKRLLATYDLPKLKELGEKFFASRDDFILKAGFSIGVFASQINKLVSSKIKKGQQDGRIKAPEGKYARVGKRF